MRFLEPKEKKTLKKCDKNKEKDPNIEKYLKIYTADDVFLNEYQEIPSENEKHEGKPHEKHEENPLKEKDPENDSELRDSMLLSTYLSLSACYLKLSHYNESSIVLKDAEKITTISSQVLFRVSQTLSFNKENSSLELEKAKKKILEAIFVVKKEPVFQKKYEGILKKLELENIEEIYRKQAIFVEERLLHRKNEEKLAFSCKFAVLFDFLKVFW